MSLQIARKGTPIKVPRKPLIQFLRKWLTISTVMKGGTHVCIPVPVRNTKNILVQSKSTKRTRTTSPITESLFSGRNLVMMIRNML